jgi:hypothetical protein
MNHQSPRRFRLRLFKRNLFLISTIFMTIVMLALIPLFKTAASSTATVGRLSQASGIMAGAAGRSVAPSQSLMSLLTLPSASLARVAAFLTAPQTSSGETIATFATDANGNCTNTPKDSFALGETVCAKVTNAPVSTSVLRRFSWSARAVATVRTANITIPTQSDTFTLPTEATTLFGSTLVDNRAIWRISTVDIADSSIRTAAYFSVHDPAQPAADVGVNQGSAQTSGGVAAGTDVVFVATITNDGPDSAQHITLTNSTPANTSFGSAGQTGGSPSFTCSTSNGTTTCITTEGLAPNGTATFAFTYHVTAGTPTGTQITNQVSVAGTTTELDPNNNSSSFSVSVTAQGTPSDNCTVTCPEDVSKVADTTDGNGNPGAVVVFPAPTGDAECGTISVDHCNNCFFPVGTTVVTATATSGDSCSFNVVVTQNTGGPTITCPADKSVNADATACSATVDPGTPTTTGSGVTVTGQRDDGEALDAPYPGGDTLIVWTATDDQDRTASCTQKITVVTDDTTPPSVTAPADLQLTTGADAATCGLIVGETELGTATASDNCGRVNVKRTGVPAGNFFPIGTTTITYTATDGGGNTATDTQTVTVTDDTVPTVTATAPNPNPPPATEDVPIQNVTVHTGANSTSCDAVVSDADLGNVQARDNCAGVSLSRSPSGNTFPVGTTTIIWTATDASGNLGTATQTVTVIDDTQPTITAPADVNAGTGPGRTSCDADPDLGTATANDNCTFTVTHSPEGPYPLGTTTVTWTVTDASGNTATDTQDVTITDTTPPVFTATAADSSASANASCQAPVPNYVASSAASDNCDSSVTLSQSPAAGTLVGKGPHTVTVTATDDAGNTSTDTVVFTVNDTTAPVISCPANITRSNDPGMCSANINPGTATATDNCDSPTVTGSRSDNQPLSAPYPVGTTTITWTATDASNNSSSCSQTITVNDTEPPAITCPASITIEATCASGAVGTYTAPTGTDNCPGATTTRTGLASGSVFPIGTSTVTYTVTDAHGNSASCSFTVTVLTPQAIIQNLKDSVNASSLSPTNKGGLIAKLDAALQAINQGKTNVACPKLNDFINSVNNLISQGALSAAQGDAWISSANKVRNTIGCTNNPCT